MGQRGVDRELPTAEDLALMRKLAEEAIRAGALGFASSRLTLHKKTSGGQPIPSYEAQYEEIERSPAASTTQEVACCSSCRI